MNKPKILVVLGPTAVGKSALAVKLARKFNGEIISADSRQVYKNLNLGTGKVTKKEMSGIPHHMLDIANPKTQYSVEKFQKESHKIIRTIIKKEKLPIVCGGTGFYIQAIVDNFSLPSVSPNIPLRKELEKKNTEQLFNRLLKLDGDRAETIDKHNKVRLIRAIEIATELGKVPTHTSIPLYEALQIGIDVDDEILRERIETRLYDRLQQGMLQEARLLRKKGLSWKRMEALGLEYRYMGRLLQKKISKEVFIRDLTKEIWHYAKRQRTWFKKDKSILWYKPSDSRKIENTVREFLK
jgi:tRNA dimethylallyltransferase